MQINPLKIYNNSFEAKNIGQNNMPKNLGPTQDVFIKTNTQVCFKGKEQRFIDSINQMAEQLKLCVFDNDFNLSAIKPVVNTVVPDLKVGLYDPRANNIVASEAGIGYLKAPIAFTADGKAALQSRELLITPPRNDSLDEKVRVYKNIVHETTHAAQYDIPEKSRVNLIRNFLKGRNIQNPETLNSIKLANNMFKGIEIDAQRPLLIALKKENNSPVAIPEASDRVLNDLIKIEVGQDLDAYLKLKISQNIEYLEKYGKVNRNFVLSFIKLAAENEKEAYHFDTQAVKNIFGMKSDSDMDLLPLLYDRLAKTADEMAKNKI